jgi:hypothetical protein
MATRQLGFSALMRAIYDRIDTHALTSSYTVYNNAIRSTSFPYITFGTPIGTESRMLGSRDTEGETTVVTVHVWSAEPGDKECADMMNNVVQAMFGTALTVTGYFSPVDVALDYSDIMLDLTDSSRPIRHGVMRFRYEIAPS